MAVVLKTTVPGKVPGVRIPPPPPNKQLSVNYLRSPFSRLYSSHPDWAQASPGSVALLPFRRSREAGLYSESYDLLGLLLSVLMAGVSSF